MYMAQQDYFNYNVPGMLGALRSGRFICSPLSWCHSHCPAPLPSAVRRAQSRRISQLGRTYEDVRVVYCHCQCTALCMRMPLYLFARRLRPALISLVAFGCRCRGRIFGCAVCCALTRSRFLQKKVYLPPRNIPPRTQSVQQCHNIVVWIFDAVSAPRARDRSL